MDAAEADETRERLLGMDIDDVLYEHPRLIAALVWNTYRWLEATEQTEALAAFSAIEVESPYGDAYTIKQIVYFEGLQIMADVQAEVHEVINRRHD